MSEETVFWKFPLKMKKTNIGSQDTMKMANGSNGMAVLHEFLEVNMCQVGGI